VPSFVSPSRGWAKARWYFFSSLSPGQTKKLPSGIVGGDCQEFCA
jgi:hypothetical protein